LLISKVKSSDKFWIFDPFLASMTLLVLKLPVTSITEIVSFTIKLALAGHVTVNPELEALAKILSLTTAL
jgi:hypothetical protein